MRARNVRLVFQKEMRDTLRDRRTLFISVVLPIVLYPVLLIGFSQLMLAAKGRIEARAQRVAVTGESGKKEFLAYLDSSERAAEKRASQKPGSANPLKLEIVSTSDPAKDLAAKKIDAWVELEPGFGTEIAHQAQGKAALHIDSTRDSSVAAESKIRTILEGYGRSVLRRRGISRADIEPVVVSTVDKASKRQRGAKAFGPTLAMLVVVMALSGAFYPAMDIMAGEKERGTMETLLVCPATRTEIVVGKYLTVFAMTVVTALLNFSSMAVTLASFTNAVPRAGAHAMALSVTPMVALAIVLALLPLAGLFSAVALSLSTFARSYKEAQHYMTPLFLGVVPLTLVALIPGTKLASFSMVPVSGVVFLLRDLMLGTAPFSQVVIAFTSTGLFAAIAIRWTVSMFNREDVLFRDPGGVRFTLLRRAKTKGELPEASLGLAAAAASLAAVLILEGYLTKAPWSGGWTFVVQFGLLLALPIVAIRWYRLDARKTLSLGLPGRWEAWPSVVAGAPAVLILMMLAVRFAGSGAAGGEQYEKMLDEFLRSVGLPVLLVVPPFVEEIFFRGFLLSSFRRRGRAWVAVVVVAAIFAFYHGAPAKYLPTAMAGIWLGYVVVATGSIWPAILAHLLNNSLSFLLPASFAPSTWLSVPSLVVLAAVVFFLERVRRAGPRAARG